MFAANTPENLARLAEFHEVRDAYFQAKKELKKAEGCIETVAGPFEGVFSV